MISEIGNNIRRPLPKNIRTGLSAKINNFASFTLLELLFVVIILGILISVSLPRFSASFNSLLLGNTSRTLQSFMNYLHQRAVVEEKILVLELDEANKEYWAHEKESQSRIRTFRLPREISVSAQTPQVLFYPDGFIDKVTIKLQNQNGENSELTTEGVYGRVKIKGLP